MELKLESAESARKMNILMKILTPDVERAPTIFVGTSTMRLSISMKILTPDVEFSAEQIERVLSPWAQKA
jgi:hypothetical protein